MAMHNHNGDGTAAPDVVTGDGIGANASTYSLDTHDTATTATATVTGLTAMDTMDMDEDFTWNGNGSPGAHVLDPMDDAFNMIGFNDDFSTYGVMGALSRNSSGSLREMGGGLNLKSSFSDNFAFPE